MHNLTIDAVFRSRRSNVRATHGMAETSQPLAALTGLDILRDPDTIVPIGNSDPRKDGCAIAW